MGISFFRDIDLPPQRLTMVSDASKKKAVVAAKRGGKAAAASSKSAAVVSSDSQNGAEKLANGFDAFAISDRTCTGMLCSHPLSRDIGLFPCLAKNPTFFINESRIFCCGLDLLERKRERERESLLLDKSRFVRRVNRPMVAGI
ncbi:hypothetical protein CIPAW_15G145800 [Carya illinoinensis]|uniref:Uncharacterized protein n=1 Tax=Carya illinoinensis TaxID=32201 RepID=A0A8T1NBG0_CARIL|nr:hypothetical protein CIPAW_15G145800 [Carya illinoinensis]